MTKDIQNHHDERGSALVYILIAIALLAALTITFMEPSSQQTQSQNTFKTVSALQSQIDFIAASIQECVIAHPSGDASAANPATFRRYPVDPRDAYLASPSGNADPNVRDVMCPGVPSEDNWRDSSGVLNDNGNDNDHPRIFGVTTGKTFPPPPDLFNDWQWYNGDDGVFFWTWSDNTDAYIQTALSKLDELYSECETDVIDATGGVENLDSGPTFTCAGGSTCFRYWLRATGSAVYNGDTDGDEAAAGCP